MFASARNKVLTVAAPKPFERFHTDLVNTFDNVAQSFYALGNTSQDPLFAYGGLNNLSMYGLEAQSLVNTLRTIIQQENLTVPDSPLLKSLDLLRINNHD